MVIKKKAKQLHDWIMQKISAKEKKEERLSVVVPIGGASSQKTEIVPLKSSISEISDVVYQMQVHPAAEKNGIHKLVEVAKPQAHPANPLPIFRSPQYAVVYLRSHPNHPNVGAVTHYHLYEVEGREPYNHASPTYTNKKLYQAQVRFSGEGLKVASHAEADFKTMYAFREHTSGSLGVFRAQTSQFRNYDQNFGMNFSFYYYAAGNTRYQPTGFVQLNQ